MAVAQRHDGVGQYGFGHPFSRMAPPSSFPNFGHDRRPMDEHSEPLWPVPRIQQQHQMGQGSAPDRSRDLAGFSSSFPQPDVLRQSGHQANYTYDGSSSALRNPVVYSQPAQLPWGAAGQSSEYTEYPTASFVTPIGQRAPLHTQPPYLGATNGAYDSSLHSGSDAFPKLMNGSASGMGSAYDHPAETLWPLGPNSLDAFAGIPAPTGQVARLTLTSASDKNKFKQRSSLPPPKQFKCSACDAIFSRNHDLKRHARIHLAVKPFPCGYCDKAFSRKDALKRHVLVKGCGIGNKKSSDNRKRAATLSKLEHSEGGNTDRAPYDGGSSESRMRDYSSFRDDLHYQGQQQQHQGFQGDSSRGFPDRLNASWSSTDASNVQGGFKTEYGAGRDDLTQSSQLSHGGSLPSYATQQPPQQYPSFNMGEDAFQQQQRQQMPGGLVNAFTSPEGTSASSPAGGNGSLLGPNGEQVDSKDGVKQLSRPGSAKLFNAVPYGSQPFPVSGGVDGPMHPNAGLNAAGMAGEQGTGDRFGPGSYPQPPMMSPALGGPTDQDQSGQHLKRQHPQPFGSGYFGNSAPN